MRPILALLLTFAFACETTSPVPSALPEAPIRVAPGGGEVWGYTGTLLRPTNPSLYEHVLDVAVPLRDGGWLVLKQVEPKRGVPRPAGTFRGPLVRPSIAVLPCAGLGFAQVAPPRDPDGRCPEVNAHAGPWRLLVTRGRVRGADEIIITGIRADPGTRELTIWTELRGDRLAVPASGVARVIELPAELRGQWLVRLDGGGDAHLIQPFVIDLP